MECIKDLLSFCSCNSGGGSGGGEADGASGGADLHDLKGGQVQGDSSQQGEAGLDLHYLH